MSPRFAYALLFSVCAFGLGTAIPAFPVDEKCGPHAEYNECGSACAPTCANPHPGPACTLQCVIGCFCKEGYLKNSQGQCVRPHECDGQTHAQLPVPSGGFPKCPENEEFKACGTACPATCAKPHPSPVCTKNCVIGCFCKDGHLRNSNGVCVPAANCEAPQPAMLIASPPAQQCKDNEVFLACGSACTPTCANPIPPAFCTLQCVIGCFCKPGYLKNSHGVCVPADKCDAEPQTCGENEEFRQCKGCDGTCDRPNPPCPRICIPGCACKKDHLRTGSNGKCIPKNSCPSVQPMMAMSAFPKCGQFEVFQACGTACPATCANPHPSPVCTRNCVVGCFCQDGYLKNAAGVCVPAKQCDPEPQTCGENEEYRQCKGCDGTCDRPNPPCPRICIPGCACKQGHLRTGANGKCIPKETCPNVAPMMAMAAKPKCAEHEVFRSCGTACPATCANPHPSPACTKNCVIGCFCQEGYLKNEKGVCVPAANCEAPKAMLAELKTEPKCPTDREIHVEECGTQLDCLASCHTPPAWLIHGVPQIPKKCLERSCTAACVCKHPYVRHENGQCVERNECDQTSPFAQ